MGEMKSWVGGVGHFSDWPGSLLANESPNPPAMNVRTSKYNDLRSKPRIQTPIGTVWSHCAKRSGQTARIPKHSAPVKYRSAPLPADLRTMVFSSQIINPYAIRGLRSWRSCGPFLLPPIYKCAVCLARNVRFFYVLLFSYLLL